MKIQWLLCWVHIEVLVIIPKWNYLNTDNYEKALVTLWSYNRLSNKINDKFMLDLFRRRKPTRILQRLPT
jgi:hypothetical protein